MDPGYPEGLENDPNAPYNIDDIAIEGEEVEQLLEEDESEE